MSSQKQRESVVSPAGEIKFAHITKPNTKFNADGEYSCDLLLDPDAAGVAELKAKLEAAAKRAQTDLAEKAKNGKEKKAIESATLYVPISNDEDKDGNETGKLLLKVKNKAKMKKRDGTEFEKRISVFDAKGKPITGPLKIGRGSTVKVAFIIAPFYNAATKNVGVTLWFEAVQIIKLVEYSAGGDAGQFGFGAEQGFEYAEETMPGTGEAHDVPSTDNKEEEQF